MRIDIKQRIEQIRRGEVPEGYKKTDIGIFPKDWRLCQLSQLLEFKNGINADKEKFGKGTKLISVRDILNDKPITYNSILGAIDVDEQQLSEFDVKFGDILFQRSSETYEEVGSSNVYLDENRTAVFSGFVIRGKKIGVYNPLYLNALLHTHYVRKSIISHAAGAQHINIGQEALAKITIALANDSEQQKIAEILSTQDKVIELYEKKIEQLQLLKKVCLQKMFPKQGSNVPEVRFPDFTEPWEQRKLEEEISSVDTGKSKYVASNSGKYEILGSTSVIGYDNTYDYEGNFLLTARVGANAGQLYRHSGKVKITDNTVFIQGNQLDFIYCALIHFDLHKLSFGTGQPLVKASELKKLILSIPCAQSEKEQIGSFFLTFDHLITLHQRQLDEEKRKKKALMQLLLTGIMRVEI